MDGGGGQKKGNMGVVRGDLYATPQPRATRVMTASEHRLESRMRTAFAQIHGADGTVPSKGIYKIRDGDGKPWRVLGRRFVEMRQKRAPLEAAMRPLEELWEWVVQDLYGDSPDRAA